MSIKLSVSTYKSIKDLNKQQQISIITNLILKNKPNYKLIEAKQIATKLINNIK
jgi:hypothetical protein